jgi:outer membrane protein OmpA-like peptidoglycan-associated protein
MRIFRATWLVVLIAAASANAQQGPQDARFAIPRADVSIGFIHVDANAPPGICNCFGVNGGYINAEYKLKPWLGIIGDFTGGHGNDISDLHQNLTLLTYMGGARVSFPHGRFVPYVQMLAGEAHGSDSYFPTSSTYTTSADSLALSPGGGLDINLTPRIAIRAIQASYLRTTFPNGVDNEQNQLTLAVGVVMKFGMWSPRRGPAAPLSPQVAQDFDFSCSTNVNTLSPGEALHVTANSSAQDVTYTWSATAGQVLGNGNTIGIDTARLSDGVYYVTGTATRASGVSRRCEVAFRVATPAPPPPPVTVAPPPPPPPPPAPEARQKAFHDNIRDVYFDLNKSTLRPDARTTVDKDAAFLVENPEMHIQIGGFADQRGSSNYNLALGERRAHAVFDRLVADGVAADHIQIVTFGRDAQACTASNEACWQQNRRVGFVLQP